MESVPRKFAIVRANRRMVDECDYLVAFVWHPASNAREFLEYARRREKEGSDSCGESGRTKRRSPGGFGLTAPRPMRYYKVVTAMYPHRA